MMVNSDTTASVGDGIPQCSVVRFPVVLGSVLDDHPARWHECRHPHPSRSCLQARGRKLSRDDGSPQWRHGSPVIKFDGLGEGRDICIDLGRTPAPSLFGAVSTLGNVATVPSR